MLKRAMLGEMKKEAEYATIRAKYRNIDGYHIFTSEDVKGLYVASKDAKKAFDSVSAVLKELISRKAKKDCEIECAMTFEEFLRASRRQNGDRPPVLQDREYVVRCAA